MSEERCPYCNGTGALPAPAVARFERMRDEYVLRLHTIGRLWCALAGLYSTARPSGSKTKAAQTADDLRQAIARVYRGFSDLELPYRVGREDHD